MSGHIPTRLLAGPFIEKIAKDVVDWQIDKKFLGDYKWHFSLLDYVNTISYNLPDKQTQEKFLRENIYEKFRGFSPM
jgi:hypothetical protein